MRVVKRKRADLAGALSNSWQSSIQERAGHNGGNSFLIDNKRQRRISVEGNVGHNGRNDFLEDMLFDRNDLRFDLVCMRLSRETQNVVDTVNECRTELKRELSIAAARSSMSSNVPGREPRSSEDGHFLKVPSREVAIYFPYVDSSRNVTSIRHDMRVRFSARPMKTSHSLSPPTYEIRMRKELPIRSIDASGVHNVFSDPVLRPSRSIVPAHRMSLASSETSRPVALLPAPSGIMPSPCTVEAPITVAGLLNSLGLGKYVIHFQAEELIFPCDPSYPQLDMMALKQMNEKDLKDLGLPMGPRKKIVQFLLALSRRHLPRQA